MNEELNNLLDGELSDGAAVDLFRSLIDDPEKRTLFRQQMKLQGALYRNETFSPMSANEEAEMLTRVSSSIGAKNSPWRRLGATALGFVAAALLLGGGLGYAVNEMVADEPQQPIVTEQVKTAPVPVVAPCNCDSAVAAVRDSMAQAAKLSSTTKKTAVKPARKKSRGLKVTTGAKEAKARANQGSSR